MRAFDDDVGVRFEQTDDLVGHRNLLLIEHSTLCLIDNLEQQCSIVLDFAHPQLRLDCIGGVTTHLVERLVRLPQGDSNAAQQLRIQCLFFRLFRMKDAKGQ